MASFTVNKSVMGILLALNKIFEKVSHKADQTVMQSAGKKVNCAISARN